MSQISGPNFPVPNSGSEFPVDEIPVEDFGQVIEQLNKSLLNHVVSMLRLGDPMYPVGHGRGDEAHDAARKPQEAPQGDTSEGVGTDLTKLTEALTGLLESQRRMNENLERIADALDKERPEQNHWSHWCTYYSRMVSLYAGHTKCAQCGVTHADDGTYYPGR